MKLTLDDAISSPQDLKGLMQELHEYSGWLMHEEIKQRAGGKSTAEKPVLSKAAKASLQSLDGDITPENLDKLVAELDKFSKNADHLTITLAAPATGAIKAELVAWCRQNIAPELLVSFNFNSTLLGGMVVRHGSRLFDWSWRRQILANGSRFTEVLKNV
jgi:hypothetical protein